MRPSYEAFQKAVCPHRGGGQNVSNLNDIKASVEARPYFVEFDVFLSEGMLYLGHPPDLQFEVTLDDALKLFAGSDVLPKVDLKLRATDIPVAVELLAQKLEQSELPRIIANVAGFPDNDDGRIRPQDYMRAEQLLLERTSEKILLNMDVERYKPATDEEIERHVADLPRPPFSISPLLGGSYVDKSLALAARRGIGQVQYWAHEADRYNIKDLIKLMEHTQNAGFQVLFDMKESNIVQESPTLELAAD